MHFLRERGRKLRGQSPPPVLAWWVPMGEEHLVDYTTFPHSQLRVPCSDLRGSSCSVPAGTLPVPLPCLSLPLCLRTAQTSPQTLHGAGAGASSQPRCVTGEVTLPLSLGKGLSLVFPQGESGSSSQLRAAEPARARTCGNTKPWFRGQQSTILNLAAVP